jgi:hypothetical protein
LSSTLATWTSRPTLQQLKDDDIRLLCANLGRFKRLKKIDLVSRGMWGGKGVTWCMKCVKWGCESDKDVGCWRRVWRRAMQRGNYLTDEGGRLIAEGLKGNSSVTKVDVTKVDVVSWGGLLLWLML